MELASWKHFSHDIQPVWDRKAVSSAWAYTVEPFQRNLPVFSRVSRHYFNRYSSTVNLLALPTFGNLSSPQNMFHFSSTQWGFSLTEPQLTKGIAHFLKQSPLACWCFLAALVEENLVKFEGQFDKRFGKQQFLKTITVEAEAYADENKRIDLVLFWRSKNDERCCAVLECKLGHSISLGQLGSYARFAEQQSDRNCYYLFVVAQQRDSRSDKKLKHWRNKEWRYLEWKELLRRWEQFLDHENVPDLDDFPRFRRTVWERTIER